MKKFHQTVGTFLRSYYLDVLFSVGIITTTFLIKRIFDPFVGFHEVPFLFSITSILFVVALRGFKAGVLSTFLSAFFIYLFFFSASAPSPKSSSQLSNLLRTMTFIAEGIFMSWLFDKMKKTEVSAKNSSGLIDSLNRHLREQVNHLEALIDVIPIGVGIANDPQCKVIHINKAYAKILEISPDANASLTGPKKDRPSYKIFKDGKEVAPDELTMQYAAQIGAPVIDNEIEIVLKNGKKIRGIESAAPLFDELGRVSGSVGAFIDITDRKKTEIELKKSKEQFELLVQATREVIWDWDIVDDKMWWNEQLCEKFGHPITQATQNSTFWQEQLHPDDQEDVMKSLTSAIEGKEKLWSKEYRFRKADGSYAFVFDRGYLLYDPEGKPVRMLGAMVDLSERREVEKRKDEFISIASHELKTPLTTIKGFTQILERKYQNSPDKETFTYLTKVNAYINKLTGLIGDLLDVTKIEAGKLALHKEIFDFDQAVHDSVTDLQLTTRTHTIEVEGKTGKRIRGDRIRIEQVISNLLSNAIKYSPGKEKICVTLEVKKKEVVFSVKDYGVGIPKDKQPNLFQKFYRVEETSQGFSGLGIGLYFSSEVITRHSGKIWVKSKKGSGSTFSFSLPFYTQTKK